MARKPRIHYNGALYHVITRGNNKDKIFYSDKDKDKDQYLKRVGKYIDRYNGKVFAYAVMDNHCHLLIQVSEVPLSKMMQLIQQTYTVYYNKKYDRSGHVFEQRYKSILVDKDSYLLTLIKYIHYNPAKDTSTGLNYKHSSHNDYVKGESLICSIDEVLALLSDNKKKAINRYCRLMSVEDDNEKIINKEYRLNINSTGGDMQEYNNKNVFSKIVEQIEDKHSIKVDILKGRHYNRKYIGIRNEFIVEIISNKAMTQVELAKYLEVSINLVSKIWNESI